jgi:hypothetical protein
MWTMMFSLPLWAVARTISPAPCVAADSVTAANSGIAAATPSIENRFDPT